MTRFLRSTTLARQIVRSSLVLSSLGFINAAHAQTPVFTPGNLVVLVEGCGVQGSTCTVAGGTGNGTNGTSASPGNSTTGGYGENQAAPITLFQFKPTGTASVTYVNSLVLPQTANGANLPVSGEYGSSSEGGLQLSGQGQYLTFSGYGIAASAFNASPATYGNATTPAALAQTNSLTGQSATAIPRVVTLVDAFGNVNSSSAIFNIYNQNNPRSVYTFDGTTAYMSGQGLSGDATSGVFYTPLGKANNAPVAITGQDTSANTASQDTRFLNFYNNTLYVSVDTKGGSNNARSFVGTLGTPPATSLFNSQAGPTQINMTNNLGAAVSSAGKIVLTAAEANTLNAPIIADAHAKNDYPACSSNTVQFNLSPEDFFFANAHTLYIADSGNTKQNSANCLYGDGGLQKWVNTAADGSGQWQLMYTLSQGLNLVAGNNQAAPTATTGVTGLYGLTGVVSGNNVYLYATSATNGDLDTSYLYGITDTLATTTNPGTSFTLLATAPPDSNFKGVSLAPTVPAGSATITTVPSGLQVTTAGTGCAAGTYVTPVTLVWTPGSACTVTTTTPQTVGSAPYFFSKWQDGNTSTTDSVVAPATAATYTATFASTFQPVVTVAPVSILVGTASTTLSTTVTYAGTVAPTGPVIFTVNGSATGVGATTCTGSASPITCTAPYTVPSLAAGTYPIVVNVPASGSFTAATGNGTLTVTALPDFTFTATTANQTVTRGTTATYAFALAPVGSYPGAVTFKVTGLPTGATATFSPATAMGNAQTITMTVATSATSAANRRPTSPWNGTRTSLVLAGLCLLPLGLRRRIRNSVLHKVALALFLTCSMVGLAGLTGCSATQLPTPNSVSTLTVTATSGSISHTATVTLGIQ